ncbi:MAG: MaoC/PaaZ C-terminal domain-containing protein [Candidatus Helarchaeota archaeon]
MAVKYADVKVGDEITPLEKKRLTREQIKEYGYASGDENPIHMDDSAAWNTGLNGVIAHGLFFIAFMQQALTDWADDPEAIKEIDLKMIGSVRAGDNIVSTGKIIEKNDSDKTVNLELVQLTYTPLIHAKVILSNPDIPDEELKDALCISSLNYNTTYEFEGRKISDVQISGEIEADCIKKVIFLSVEEGAVKEWARKGEKIDVEILEKIDDQVEFIIYRERQSLAGKATLKLK